MTTRLLGLSPPYPSPPSSRSPAAATTRKTARASRPATPQGVATAGQPTCHAAAANRHARPDRPRCRLRTPRPTAASSTPDRLRAQRRQCPQPPPARQSACLSPSKTPSWHARACSATPASARRWTTSTRRDQFNPQVLPRLGAASTRRCAIVGSSVNATPQTVSVYRNLLQDKQPASATNPKLIVFAVMDTKGACAAGVIRGYPNYSDYAPVDIGSAACTASSALAVLRR